jgi:hypothetical protein
MAAVKQYGLSLYYVKNKSDEICLAAVKNNPYAIKYVDKPTDEIHVALKNVKFPLDLR